MASQPGSPIRSKGLIAGLTKGNQWLSQALNKAPIPGRGILGGVG